MPEGWGGPKISRFFCSLPPEIFILSSLSGGFLVEFWWCLKRRDAQICTFGVLWLSCEAPAAWTGGFHNLRAQTCTFQGPRPSKTPPKFNEKTSQREKKERNFRWEREKKRAKFWAVQGKGGPAEGGSGREAQKILNTPTTQAPTGTTNRHQQAPTGTNRHQAPTGTNRHQQAPPTNNYKQQPRTTTTTWNNNNKQQKTRNNNNNNKKQ